MIEHEPHIKVDEIKDGSGKILETRLIFPDGSVEESTKYQYDDDGRLESTTTFDSRGNLAREKQFFYNDLGQEEKSVVTNGTGKILSQENVIYGEDGRVKQKISYGDSHPDQKTVYNYRYSGDEVVVREETIGTGEENGQ